MLDSPIIASAQAYTSSMAKTSKWSLMPAKRCFPRNASIQTAKKLCFALCGPSSVSLITSVHRKSSSRLVISQSPSSTVNASGMANTRIATWLMTLQGRDFEARYAQNYKSSLGNGLAACQNCSTDMLHTSAEPKEPSQPQLTNHRYFEENVCEGMPTAYVNGCSYNHKGNLKAGAGVVWLNNDPCPPQQFKLGPHSSQYAEIAASLITLQLAASHNIKEFLICTDSNYARLSFTCHLAGWKQNGFKTANNKPVKHQELFQAGDAIVTECDMIVYWKKV